MHMAEHSTLTVWSPDILPIIADHLPLYARSSTLLALALTNHAFKVTIIPHLLYRLVCLEGEKRTLEVLSGLRAQAKVTDERAPQRGGATPVGHLVHRLHISSELSKGARTGNFPDAVSQLRELINHGGLPNLESLALHLRRGWHFDDDFVSVDGFGRVEKSFWTSVKQHCPRLQEITLTGVQDYPGDRWLEGSGLFEFQGLTCFRLGYQCSCTGTPDESPPTASLYRLFNNLATCSPYLHSLTLHLDSEDYVSLTSSEGLFTWRFPHLCQLSLRQFRVDSREVATDFWMCHPNLERIQLLDIHGSCFETPPAGFLPRLRVLMAPFEDVLMLVPVIGDQLINLTVSNSVNAQVLYLVCSVLPGGLPSLRSLGIVNYASNRPRDLALPGARWLADKRSAPRTFDVSYLKSLAHGVPNLEELELMGECGPSPELVADSLAIFQNLKRLYFWGRNNGLAREFLPPEKVRSFITQVANRCVNIESITEVTGVAGVFGYYNTLKIQRSHDDDDAITFQEQLGCGRVVGCEDDDFPCIWC